MTTTINIPDLGGATDVVAIEIPISVGSEIKQGDIVAVLESDKATFEVPSPYAGTIKSILIKQNDTVTEETPIAEIETQAIETASEPKKVEPVSPTIEIVENASPVKPDISAEQKDESRLPNHPQTEPSADTNIAAQIITLPSKSPEVETKSSTAVSRSVHAGPAVRHLAHQFGINLDLISGTGPKNRILKEDVQDFIKQKLEKTPSQTQPQQALPDFEKFGPISIEKLTRLKTVSANNLQSSWQTIPHVTQFIEADITELEAFRKSQSTEQQKLTLLPFLITTLVKALQRHPIVNSSYDATNQQLILKSYYHIGVAVDTPQGLVVPVIKNAEQQSISAIAENIKMLSEKARDKTLHPTDMQGASCTITSLGKLGGRGFTPIINPPEVAILGVGSAEIKPVWQNNQFIPRLLLPLSLSYDHRVVNGADGGRFLQTFVELLSDIRLLLL